MTPMVVQCSSCLTEFELDPNKVPAVGVRARCSVCSAVITVPPPAAAAVTPSSESSAHEAPQLAQDSSTDQSQAHSAIVEESPAEESEPQAAAATDWRAAPQESAKVAEPAHAAETSNPAPSPAHSGWAAPGTPAAPFKQQETPHADADAAQRRPINPFLTRDPALRAKRLARALVSDIVAYHPARHAEGLRDGTLKTLFRDEIKKSYEEYVDQVGRDFAGSTTHFQDALNDVLASGKKLF
jgi:predicted Zn finger-like uncharacterized protein